MKINEPITEDQHRQADNDYRELAEKQKKRFLELADRVQAGESLDDADRLSAASLIRKAANAINPKRQRPAGRPTLIPDEARLVFARMVTRDGLSRTKAAEQIATIYNVSIEAVKKKMGMTGNKEERDIAAEETKIAFWLVAGP